MVRLVGVESVVGDLTHVISVGTARRRANGYLFVLEDDASRVVELPSNGAVLLGRGEEAVVRLRDRSVSRRHATISRIGARTHVRDLASQNGTHVNGERIVEPRPLASGDTLTVGAVTLIYHAGGDQSPPAEAARRVDLGDRAAIIADPAMAKLYQLVERLAATELPVLITGETGTGKELAARALHQMSPRRARPLVTLNCAALQETLVESELFGYERGAFTGAATAKPGLLETASGGTLLLDEVGELSPAVQAKLLRVLETKRVLRVGDVRERAIDIRVIAATNRDLARDVAEGRFRRDLYFRLGAATIAIPPLRERPRELPILARAFLRDACLENGRDAMELSADAERVLAAHPWPGNVRELKHAMEYLSAVVPERSLEPRHLHLFAAEPLEPARFRPLADEVRELERTRITSALAAAGGNQRTAARLLGMPLRTFVFKLRAYGLRRADAEQ